MRQILFLFMTLLTLAACGPSDDTVRIKGEFKYLNKGEFYIISDNSNWKGFDTIRVEGGEFSYDHALAEPAIVTIQYPNFSQMTIIAEPGKTIEIEGDARNLATTSVKGTPDNEALTKFRINMLDKSSAEIQKEAAKFIKEHPASIASEAILRTYLLQNDKPDAKLILPLINVMAKAQPANLSLITLITSLRPFLLNAEGQPLPKFSCTSLDGKKIDNKQFKGKYLLINFWAEWNTRSLEQIRTVTRNASNKIALLNISLDYNKEAFKGRIKADSIPGTNVCDGLSWSSPIVKTLGVRFVPGNMLINPNGFITARDLTAEELEKKLSQIRNE